MRICKTTATMPSCVEPGGCTPLYARSAKNKNQGSEQGQCCEPDQKLISTNVTTALFSGYKADASDTKKYGCCPVDRVYMKTKTTSGCSNRCGSTTQEEACCPSDKKVVSGECCDKNKVYTDNGVEKCCDGIVSDNGTVCVQQSAGSCVVDWVPGHAWQYKECTTSLTLPKDGTWKISGNLKVYVGDSSKCSISIGNNTTITVANGSISNYTGIDKKSQPFTATWSYQGTERQPRLGFTCNTPVITTKGRVITFKVKVTPAGPQNPHIHVPYAGGVTGSITNVTRQ